MTVHNIFLDLLQLWNLSISALVISVFIIRIKNIGNYWEQGSFMKPYELNFVTYSVVSSFFFGVICCMNGYFVFETYKFTVATFILSVLRIQLIDYHKNTRHYYLITRNQLVSIVVAILIGLSCDLFFKN